MNSDKCLKQIPVVSPFTATEFSGTELSTYVKLLNFTCILEELFLRKLKGRGKLFQRSFRNAKHVNNKKKHRLDKYMNDALPSPSRTECVDNSDKRFLMD